MNKETYNNLLEESQRTNGNHTFDVEVHLGNMTSKQVSLLNNFLDAMEENGAIIYSFNKEND